MTKSLFDARSTFWDGDRKAETYKIKDTWYVGMFIAEELVEFRSMRGHNENYAENCAENFVMRIGEFNKQYDLSGVFDG